MNPEILYEDAYLALVNKPSNCLVHHSKYAENKRHELSVCQWIEQNFDWKPNLVHRLDYKTSGVLLIAKASEHVHVLQELFTTQTVEKTYLALLRGHTPPKGRIDSPVKNERGNYKEALSSYSTLQHFELAIPVPPYAQSRYSLVKFQPHTGRTNQLRIHANKISHPMIGDPKFGNRHHNHMFQAEMQIPYLFLHASNIRFVHPFTQQTLKIEAPKPDFWDKFLRHPKLKLIPQDTLI